jgi:hypothetical protein
MTSTQYIGMDVHKESISIFPAAFLTANRDRIGHRDESQQSHSRP